MKPGRKRVILRAMAVLVVVVGVIVLAFMPREDPREAKARRLIAELRQPSALRQWLVRLGVVQRRERRHSDAIVSELAALGQPAVPVCIRALRDDDWHVRWGVAEALGQMDPVPRKAAAALIQSLKDEYSEIRYLAAKALGSIPSEADKIAPALVGALNHRDFQFRQSLCKALVRLGDPAISALVAGLKAERWLVRAEAARALAMFGHRARESAPALLEALRDERSQVRAAAAEALGNIGPAAKEAIPALKEALKDEKENVREAAAEALKKIQAAATTRAAPTTQPGGKQ